MVFNAHFPTYAYRQAVEDEEQYDRPTGVYMRQRGGADKGF